MSLTAGEQYLIELINRGRLDPLSEAARYNLDLNAGLAAGTIGTHALQVLAPNTALDTAATRHSDWMLANDSFSHGGAGGSNAGDRMQSAGYVFTGTWGWRENLAWLGSTGGIDLEASIAQHHEGLYRSQSHRENTFAPEMREIGIGQVGGSFTYQGTTYNSSMVTEKFAVSGSGAYVTGVAYRDADRDDFYSRGEGQQDVWFKVGNQLDRTASAGGYAVHVEMQDNLDVLVGRGGQLMAKVELDTSEGNVKLDLVTQGNGIRMLETSGDMKLVWGVGGARLLGSGNLELTGSNFGNLLEGNRGANLMEGAGGNDLMRGMNGNDAMFGGDGNDRIYGGTGHDRMFGGDNADVLVGDSGNDVLWGQLGNDRLFGGDGNDILLGNGFRDMLYGGDGNDRLDGGAGSDVMVGGAGADLFIFSAHRDTVVDFQDNVDTVAIRNYLGDGDLTVREVLAMGEIRNGNAVFDFGNDHVLTINHVTNLAVLANDMIIL